MLPKCITSMQKLLEQCNTFLYIFRLFLKFYFYFNVNNLVFYKVCNRTYYGDVGRTYTLRVPPPQWNRLPFLCHLTFTASGHDQGDIVQVYYIHIHIRLYTYIY